MPKKAARDWDVLEQEMYAAGVKPSQVEAGPRRRLAEARGHQLAEERRQAGLGRRDVVGRMGGSVAQVS
jgi:hypothetical protein